MKRISILLIFVIALCGSVFAKNAPKNGGKPKISDLSKASLVNFSTGMYRKNLALSSSTETAKYENIQAALKSFFLAAQGGSGLDVIYDEISDCYAIQMEFNQSIEFAQKSISVNNKNINPYTRIYEIYQRLRNYKKAAEIFEAYLKVAPNTVHVQFVLGENYLRNLKDSKKSEYYFKSVLETAGRFPVEDYYRSQAYYYLGHIAYKDEKYNEADEYFSKVYEIDRGNLNAIFMLAIINMDKYELDDAINFSSIYVARVPDNMKMHSVLGTAKYLKGESGALYHLRMAIPAGQVDGVLARGLYAELLNNDDEAEGVLNALVKYSPRMIAPHLGLARINLRKNNPEPAFTEFLTTGVLFFNSRQYSEALSCFTSAEKIKSSMPEIYFYIGRCYEEKGSISLAIVNYKKAISLKQDNDLLVHVGYLYGMRKDFDSALECFDEAMKTNPKNSQAYFYKGLVSMWSNNYVNAETNIKKAIDLKDDVELYYFYLAVVQEKKNRIPEAIDSLEKAIKANPKSSRSYNFLGFIYADKNIKIEESYQMIRKALEMEPDNGAYLDSMGWVYYRKGEFRQALEYLLDAERKLREKKSQDPIVYDHIGDTYLKLGRLKKAIEFWKKSIELEKNDSISGKISKYEKTGR